MTLKNTSRIKKSLFIPFILLTVFSTFSQEKSENLIWKNCVESESKKDCGYDFASKALSRKIEKKLIEELHLAKIDTLIVSSRLYFNDQGHLNPDYSALYSPNGFESQLDEILYDISSNDTDFALENLEDGRREIINYDFHYAINDTYLQLIDLKEIKKRKDYDHAFKERVPVYRGCNSKSTNRELIKCSSTELAQFFISRFKAPKDIKKGTYKIILKFEVGANGNVENVSAESDYPSLIEETLRISEKLKGFKEPGYIGKKAVKVPFSLPIILKI